VASNIAPAAERGKLLNSHFFQFFQSFFHFFVFGAKFDRHF